MLGDFSSDKLLILHSAILATVNDTCNQRGVKQDWFISQCQRTQERRWGPGISNPAYFCRTATSFSMLLSLPFKAFFWMHLMATNLLVFFSSARNTSENAPLKHKHRGQSGRTSVFRCLGEASTCLPDAAGQRRNKPQLYSWNSLTSCVWGAVETVAVFIFNFSFCLPATARTRQMHRN